MSEDAVLWFAVGALCSAVAIVTLFPAIPLALLCAAVSFLASLIVVAGPYHRTRVVVAFIVFMFGLGCIRTAIVPVVTHPLLDRAVGTLVTIEGLVVTEPEPKNVTTNAVLEVARFATQGATSTIGDIHVLASVAGAHTSLSYGDRVVLTGVIERPKSFEDDSGHSFDYAGYLASQGVGYRVSFAHATVVQHGQGSRIVSKLLDVKHWFLEGITRVLPEPQASLAGGITVGEKRALSNDVKNEFMLTGLTPIIVLSGYNITIVVQMIENGLKGVPVPLVSAATLVWVLSIVIVSGAGASAVRAGIMAVVLIGARVLKRRYVVARALACSISVMVLVNPRIVLGDPGFQLSVAATLGLVYVAPAIDACIRWPAKRFMKVREAIVTTLGAQIAVLPLILWSTGTLSLVAFPVNVLLLPLIPYTMFASAVVGFTTIVPFSIAAIVALPAYLMLTFILYVSHVAAILPFAAVTLPPFSLVLVAGAYVALGYFVYKWGPVGKDGPPWHSVASHYHEQQSCEKVGRHHG